MADVEGKTGKTERPEAEGMGPGGFLDGWELSTQERDEMGEREGCVSAENRDRMRLKVMAIQAPWTT